MRATVTLDEKEVAEAIALYLVRKGMVTTAEKVTLKAHHDPGDRPWEGPRSWVTATAEVG